VARIRTIKPEFWQDEDLACVSESACLLAIGLLNHSDDEGYFRANPALVKAAVFPFRDHSLNIHGMFSELSNIGYLELFEGSDGKQYGYITGFTKHQKVNRGKDSKIKPLRQFTETSVTNHGSITPGKEQGTGKGKENNSSRRARIATDFKPDDRDYLVLTGPGKQIPRYFIDEQREDFIAYWIEQGGERDDWHSRFRERVIRQWQRQKEAGNAASGRDCETDFTKIETDEGFLRTVGG